MSSMGLRRGRRKRLPTKMIMAMRK